MADFKNDSILRTILVVFIGILAFCLLFNLFTGGGTTMDGGHMGNMGASGGLSFGGLIGGLLLLLVKILMIVLVVAVLIGIFVWIKNNFFQNSSSSQFLQSINKDPILKTVSIVTVVIIGIVLLFALFNSFSQSGMGFGGQMGANIIGFNPMYSIAGLLTLLSKVLMFILVVSLIMAAVAYIKKQYDAGNLNFFAPAKSQEVNAVPNNVNSQQIFEDSSKIE